MKNIPNDKSPKPKRDWNSILSGVAIVVSTFLVYSRSLSGEFLWDDDSNILESRPLRSLSGLAQIWFQPMATQQYYPLTHSSFWLDYHLWGLNPMPYHLENVLLHSLGAVLLWLVLRRLAVPGAWLGAALFALHPVCVESVAWVTERKNTLSGVFFLGSLLASLKFWRLEGGAISKAAAAKAGETSNAVLAPWKFYWLTLGLYVCALLSKTATIGLPVVIWLLIWWKRGWPGRRDILLLLPFLAAAIPMGLMTMWVERHNLGVTGEVWGDVSFAERCLIAARALWFYLEKLVWPHPLMFMYPRWTISATDLLAYLPVAATVIAFVILWLKRASWGRAGLFVTGYFFILLFPILGFFNGAFFFYSFVNDHFQYLACMGPLALAAAGLHLAIARFGKKQPLLKPAVCGALLLTLGALSWRQTQIYQNVETLWRDTLARNPDSWMAHDNLGSYLSRKGNFAEAADHYLEAIRLRPTDPRAYNNLGLDLARNGKLDEAVQQIRKSVELVPNYAKGHYNLGRVLATRGNTNEALQHFSIAAQLDPDFAPAQFSLGSALEREGKRSEAMQCYRRTLELEPDFALAHASLGRLLAAEGKTDQAIRHYQQALEINPNSVDALANLANALLGEKRIDEAVSTYRRALQINPNSPVIHYNLAVALSRQGNQEEAQAEMTEAQRLQAGSQPIEVHLK